MALTYDNLTALTHDHIEQYIVDNVYKSFAFLYRLKAKGRAIRGGATIRYPIMYQGLNSGTFFNGSDTWSLPTVDFALYTTPKFDWKEAVVPWAVSDRLANIENDGEEAAVDYIDSVAKSSTLAMADLLDGSVGGLFSDGTGFTGDGIDGLQELMSTTGTYGGIAVADAPTWVAQNTSLINTDTLTVADMQRLWGLCTIGADQPTLLLSNQFVFNTYSSLLEPQRRYVNTMKAVAGFPTLEFMGRDYMVDNHSPGTGPGTGDSALYLINERWVNLFVKKERDFSVVNIPPQATSNNMYFKIGWAGNLGCNQRRQQGFFDDIDPGILSA